MVSTVLQRELPWGLFFIRSSGKGKKQPSLHYTAAQLLEKGVLVEIEDLPTSQYVSLAGRTSAPSQAPTWGSDSAEHRAGGKEKHGPCLEGAVRMMGQTGLCRELRAVGVVWRSSGHPRAEDAGKVSWRREQWTRAKQIKVLRCGGQK